MRGETVLDVFRGGVHIASFPRGWGITVQQGQDCAQLLPPSEATVEEVRNAEKVVAAAALLALRRLGWTVR